MVIIAIIPAKSDSTRLKNKNMINLEGKPLIYYTIKAAMESNRLDAIYVSTDSDEIANYARSMGARVVKRSKELCGDVPLRKVYSHALESMDMVNNITYLVGLQPDNPDRNINIDRVITEVVEENVDELYSVDRQGEKNGSIWIIKAENFRKGQNSKVIKTVMDPCTNIHTRDDLLTAKKRMFNKNNGELFRH